MTFLNPAYLWTLLGLGIPISIHLLSRKEGRVILVGSLRHLNVSNTSRFKSIRLNEILLLLLRCLFILLLTSIVSGLRCTNFPFQSSVNWVLVEYGLENDEHIRPMVDSLQKEGYEVRYLATGFPLVTMNELVPEKVDYRARVHELKSYTLQNIIVFSHSRIAGYKGAPIALPANVQWIVVDSEKPELLLSAVRWGLDSVRVRIGTSQKGNTTFTTEKKWLNRVKDTFSQDDSSDSIKVAQMDTIHVAMLFDKEFSEDQRILKAIFLVLQQEGLLYVKLSEDIHSRTEWIIWLQKHPPITFPSIPILTFENRDNSSLLEKVNDTHWILTRRLNEQAIVKEHLPAQLMELLAPAYSLEARVEENDHRTMPETLSWIKENDPRDEIKEAYGKDMTSYLFVLLLLTLIGERILAFRRNQ